MHVYTHICLYIMVIKIIRFKKSNCEVILCYQFWYNGICVKTIKYTIELHNILTLFVYYYDIYDFCTIMTSYSIYDILSMIIRMI